MPMLAPALVPLLVSAGGALGTGATVGGGLAGIGMIAGVAGTVLGVVGKITKSKLLGQIGMGLGIAGAVMGLGAMGASAGLFGETAKGAMAMNASSLAGAPGSTAAAMNPALGTVEASRAVGGLGTSTQSGLNVGTQPGIVSTGLSLPTSPMPGLGGALPPGGVASFTAPPTGMINTPLPGLGQPASGLSNVNPDLPRVTGFDGARVGGPRVGGGHTGAGGFRIDGTSVAPSGPPGGAPYKFDVPGVSTYGPGQPGYGVMAPGAVPPPPPVDAGSSGLFDWFKNLDKSYQAMFINTAGQGVSGTVGGIFSSIQADRQSELLEQINRENRQYQRWQSEQAPGLIQFQQ